MEGGRRRKREGRRRKREEKRRRGEKELHVRNLRAGIIHILANFQPPKSQNPFFLHTAY